VHEGFEPGEERVGLAGRHLSQSAGEQVQAEYLAVLAQHVVSRRGQPYQRAPPVGRVVLALEQSLVLQVADDLADDRLGPGEVCRGLADRQRPSQREVLEHGPGRTRELAAGPVAAVKRQVHRPEQGGEPLGLLTLISHATRVPPALCIVNPDGFSG
jgi:hypothetical protein